MKLIVWTDVLVAVVLTGRGAVGTYTCKVVVEIVRAIIKTLIDAGASLTELTKIIVYISNTILTFFLISLLARVALA